MFFYGIVHQDQPLQFADAVCAVLGQGKNRVAVRMLLETCAQETHLGRFRDANFYEHGIGLYQMDRIGWQDVVARTKQVDVHLVRDKFGFDIRSVQHRDLAFSPLMATVFARLFYKLKPDEFPAEVEGRALYWKQNYNTAAGKGSVAEYLNNVRTYLS